MKPRYSPIDCHMYDELVLLAMKKTPVLFVPNFYNIPSGAYIKDVVTKSSKEEFMILSNDQEIRLDLVSFIDDHIVFINVDDDIFEEE